ncbi:hypothetical protein IFR05_004393 [Cadophora sp. M221]|nr:hypothetical protein IFR05_004393 [Cadophora sp. M221]
MDVSRSAHGQFKQLAFSWKSVFSQRRTNFYAVEDQRYVESFPDSADLSTEEMVDRFVQNQCTHDLERYLYRKRHLSDFLELATMGPLEQILPQRSTLTVLMDDRNDETVTRDSFTGNFRPSLGPLSAQRFYTELMRPAEFPNAERRLIQNSDEERDMILEAQVSIMVIGLDDWFWTAYCFADVYFKEEDHRERIYAFTRGEAGEGESIDLDITQRKGFRWTIRVLRQFTHVLSKTIDSWDTFKDGEIRYFNLPDSEVLADASWGSLLAAIDRDVIELRDLRSSLQHKTELFENMTNSIVTHAAHAETIITRLQSQFIQALTVITIFYLPPTLASSIFSMQDSIFTDPKFRDWLFTLVGLFMATALLVLAVLAFNHPRIGSWLGFVWKSMIVFLSKGPQALRHFKQIVFGDGRPDPHPAGIEMDERDDGEPAPAGEV